MYSIIALGDKVALDVRRTRDILWRGTKEELRAMIKENRAPLGMSLSSNLLLCYKEYEARRESSQG